MRETVEEAVSKLCIDGIPFNTIANSEMLQKLGKNYQFAPDKKNRETKIISIFTHHIHSSSNNFIKLKYCWNYCLETS